MSLKISKALERFNLAEYVDLDCGTFDVKIRQAAVHNDGFRAAVAKKALAAKRKSLAPDPNTITGRLEDDMELICHYVIQGWGTRPLCDDDGKEVDYSPDVMLEIFKSGTAGKTLYGKISMAAVDESLFVISDDDLKNS